MMDAPRRKELLVGDLARLKMTWNKVEERIAEVQEAKEQERQRVAEEARKAREAEAQRREDRRLAVRNAITRLETEIGGFYALPPKSSFARVHHDSTEDVLSINEGPGEAFLIFVDSAVGKPRSSADTKDLQEPLTSDAVLVRILETLIDKNHDYLPTDPSQEGRIL